MKIQHTCHHCEKPFTRQRTHIRVKKPYCSRQCKAVHEQVRITNNCVICNIAFQVRPSEQHKILTCSKQCNRKRRRSVGNPNWRGGTTSSRKCDMSTLEYKQWRRDVFERDDYTCVFCSKRGGTLNADHIKPWVYYPLLRYELSNGRTLCVKCHQSIMKEVFTHRAITLHP